MHQICGCRTYRLSRWVPFHHSCCGIWMQPSHQSWHASSAQIGYAPSSGGLGLRRTTTSPSIGCNRDLQEWQTHLSLEKDKTGMLYGLLTTCEDTMAEFRSKLFLCLFDLWTETESRSNERSQYPAMLIEQACLIKDLFYGFRRTFSRRAQRVVPSGKNSVILSCRIGNQRRI